MTQWGLDTLFNPAKRHMDEEKRRLQATRQQVGDTSGGKRIDLESGKVRIGKGRGDGEADTDGDEVTEVDQVDETVDEVVDETVDAAPAKAAKSAKKGKPAKELTPAQLRAAQRRGRAPR